MTIDQHSIEAIGRANPRHHGFTLVELMVATAVTIILVVLVGGLVTNVLNTWGRSSGLLSSNSQANALLQSLQTDWEAALFRADGNEWGYLVNEGGSGPLANFNHATRMLFFSQVLDRQTAEASGAPIHGDLCAVSHRIIRQNPYGGSGTPTYGAYRAVVAPDVTFHALVGQQKQTNLPQLWEEKVTYQRGVNSGQILNLSDYQKDVENFLAANVVDLAITPWYKEPGTGAVIPLRGTPVNPLPLAPGEEVFLGQHMRLGSGGAPLPLPVFLDVSVTILSTEGARRLRNEESGGGGSLPKARFDQIAREHGHTFTRRIINLARSF